MKYFVGLDIGGTKCAVVLATLNHGIHVHSRIAFPTGAENGFSYTKNRLFQTIRDILAQNKLDLSDVRAIGVSCGGPLDSRRGLILSPPNLPGWDNIPLAKMLTEEFRVPAFLQNDANACALVEWKLGAGRGAQNMIFLTMGTGMGAGIIAEGKLLCGSSDMAGEVGHIRLEDDGPVGFGKAGSFEGFCSGMGIGRQAREMTGRWMDEGRTPAWIRDGIKPEDVNAKVIGQYADRGDVQAQEIYRFIGGKLGKGVSTLIDVLNPEIIVIGSIFVHSESMIRPSMEAVVEKEALIQSREVCKIVPAQTGESLGDFASVMVACHALGIDPCTAGDEEDPEVLTIYRRLFERYPDLMPAEDAIMQAYLTLAESYRRGGKLLVCGNGGSAADADHIVGELMKGFFKKRPLSGEEIGQAGGSLPVREEDGSCLLQGALPAVALTQHAALSTAFLNDVDPYMVFAQQVYGYGKKGDAFLGISTSGNSIDVVHAAQVARARGLSTIALTGPSGGRLRDCCDITVCVPGDCTGDIQERHLPVYHTLCAMLEEKFF